MVLDLFKLNGKAAVVTGTSSGLGEAIAEALAQAGADVCGAARRESVNARKKVEAAGRRFTEVRIDFSEAGPVDAVIERCVEAFGRVDILVNNAGTIRRADAIDFTEADWDAVMNTNLKSLFFLSQRAAKEFIPRGGGKIINIASMLSFQGGVRVSSYTASKSGVMGLTRLMANEWAKHNINANAIAPGYMATDNTKALREDPERNAQILGRIPAGRWGNPEDLSGAAVFLASAASDYMNGFTVAVDGGWLAR